MLIINSILSSVAFAGETSDINGEGIHTLQMIKKARAVRYQYLAVNAVHRVGCGQSRAD